MTARVFYPEPCQGCTTHGAWCPTHAMTEPWALSTLTTTEQRALRAIEGN